MHFAPLVSMCQHRSDLYLKCTSRPSYCSSDVDFVWKYLPCSCTRSTITSRSNINNKDMFGTYELIHGDSAQFLISCAIVENIGLCVSIFDLGLLCTIYFLQVWCILLDDKVPFRMHWPLHSDMQINGISIGLPFVLKYYWQALIGSYLFSQSICCLWDQSNFSFILFLYSILIALMHWCYSLILCCIPLPYCESYLHAGLHASMA